MSPTDDVSPRPRGTGPNWDQFRRLRRTSCPYTRRLTPDSPARTDALHMPVLTRSSFRFLSSRPRFYWTCAFCELREPLVADVDDVLARPRRTTDREKLFWHATLTALLVVGTTVSVVSGASYVGITFVVLVWSTLAIVNRTRG